jgi:cell division protein FtsW (lipid II flippase)
MNQAQSQIARPRPYRLAELGLLILAIAVATSAYALVGLGVEDTIPANVYGYAGWLAALGLILHVVIWIKAKYADPVLVPIAVLLNGLGLAMIYRVDLGRDEYLGSGLTQLIWMTLGVGLAIAVIFIVRDHRWLRRYTYRVRLRSPPLPSSCRSFPVIGKTINGARIWIGVGSMSFQPGEIAKILLAIFFAGYLVSYKDQLVAAGPKILGIRFPRLRDFGPIVIAWVASVGILVFEKDLGTSLLFFGLFVAMLYVATSKVSWIILGLGFFAAGAVAATFLFTHVQQRVDGWLNALTAEEYNKEFGGSYQLVQGLFGMSNGGLVGTGFGEGRPNMVPYAESDFIYASFGEEIGLAGLFVILLCYLFIFQRGIRTAQQLRDGFGTLLATGLSFTIALQVFVVVGGVTRLIPLTGLTTPFLAQGGSSLIANWMIIGLLLRISDNARRPVEDFHTGVLRIPEDPEPAKKTAPAAVGTGAAGRIGRLGEYDGIGWTRTYGTEFCLGEPYRRGRPPRRTSAVLKARHRRPTSHPQTTTTRPTRTTLADTTTEVNDEEAIDAYRRRRIRHVRAPVRIDELGPVRHRGFAEQQSAEQSSDPRSARPRPRPDPRRRHPDRLFGAPSTTSTSSSASTDRKASIPRRTRPSPGTTRWCPGPRAWNGPPATISPAIPTPCSTTRSAASSPASSPAARPWS